jgi:hypothetical protein
VEHRSTTEILCWPKIGKVLCLDIETAAKIWGHINVLGLTLSLQNMILARDA